MIIVPFDGSELAEAGLVRAAQFGEVFDTTVVAVSVIPDGNTGYARERDWLDETTEFDRQEVVSTLHEQVTDIAPGVEFQYELAGRSAAPGAIASKVRSLADQREATMVVVGSENAGRLVTGVSSVGGNIATSGSYDVLVVRDPTPAETARERDSAGDVIDNARSDFYF
jgi:nucleotide-binding universal stress UspA family protein